MSDFIPPVLLHMQAIADKEKDVRRKKTFVSVVSILTNINEVNKNEN